jgi:hypothetical protein
VKRWIAGIILLVVAGAAAFVLLPRHVPDLPPLRPLVVNHVTIINPGAAAQPDMTVVIRGDRIVAVSRDARSSPDALLVDGRGKFLIPGLWDMHIHGVYAKATRDFVQPLLVVNGVTGARVMASELPYDQISRQKEPHLQPDQLAPRTVSSGRTVNGPRGASKTSIVVQSARDGTAAIDSVLRSGGTFVKLFNNTPRAAYFTLLHEARSRGVRVTGHLPWEIDALEASDSGQAIEHVTSLMRSCSSREVELRDSLTRVRGTRAAAGTERRVIGYANNSFDLARCRVLAARFAAHQTWLAPTLAAVYRKTTSSASAAAVHYVPGGKSELEDARAWEARRSAGEQRFLQLQWQHARKIVNLMHRAGAPILAATDAIAPTLVPGFSLHDELALLVSAGLTPAEALDAATGAPVRYLGMTDSLGSIAPGKLADLVLLAGNPLADIRNTRKIEAVVLRGHFLERRYLDDVLRDLRRRARNASLKQQIAHVIH